jgi:hypothetical protein
MLTSISRAETRRAAKSFGFTVYPTITEAVCAAAQRSLSTAS